MTDPFAEDFNPIADSTPEDQPVTNTTPAPVVVPREGKVVVTLKGGAGFDAPWIVVHAENAQDALDQLNDPTLSALIDRTKAVAAHFVGGSVQRQSSVPAQQQAPQGRPGQPPASMEAPNGEKRYCAHGEMSWRSGFRKSDNKPYSGWYCPSQDRNNQCRPQYPQRG